MTTGKVKWFDTAKGFGFIIPDGGPKDVFVHARELQKCGIHPSNMVTDAMITFNIQTGPKGVFATDLKME